jgi:hypothetical protein
MKSLTDLMQDLQDEKEQKAARTREFEEHLRQEVGKHVTSASADLSDIFDEKMKQNEQLLIRMQIKNGSVAFGADNAENDLKNMKAQTQQSYIDTVINTLRVQMQSEMTKRIS